MLEGEGRWGGASSGGKLMMTVLNRFESYLKGRGKGVQGTHCDIMDLWCLMYQIVLCGRGFEMYLTCPPLVKHLWFIFHGMDSSSISWCAHFVITLPLCYTCGCWDATEWWRSWVYHLNPLRCNPPTQITRSPPGVTPRPKMHAYRLARTAMSANLASQAPVNTSTRSPHSSSTVTMKKVAEWKIIIDLFKEGERFISGHGGWSA